MDLRKVRRWVSNPFGNKTDESRFHKTRSSSADERRRYTISLDSTPIVSNRSIDITRPTPIIIPQNPLLEAMPMNDGMKHQVASPDITEPMETPTAPPNSPVPSPENLFRLPISNQIHSNNPSRSHGYKTKLSGKIKQMKGMLIGDWEMQVRGEMQLLDGEAEITAYRLLKYGYQLNEIVCG